MAAFLNLDLKRIAILAFEVDEDVSNNGCCYISDSDVASASSYSPSYHLIDVTVVCYRGLQCFASMVFRSGHSISDRFS